MSILHYPRPLTHLRTRQQPPTHVHRTHTHPLERQQTLTHDRRLSTSQHYRSPTHKLQQRSSPSPLTSPLPQHYHPLPQHYHLQLQKAQQHTQHLTSLLNTHTTLPRIAHKRIHTVHSHIPLSNNHTLLRMAPSHNTSMPQAHTPPTDNPKLEIILRSKSKSNRTSDAETRNALRQSEGGLGPRS